jgi:hypothetical protein
VGAGVLRRDVEAEAEPLLAGSGGGAREGLEQVVEGVARDRLAEIGDGELEAAVVAVRGDPDRGGLGAMGESVREQVGEQLSDALPVADDGPAQREFTPDRALRPCGLELGRISWQMVVSTWSSPPG